MMIKHALLHIWIVPCQLFDKPSMLFNYLVIHSILLQFSEITNEQEYTHHEGHDPNTSQTCLFIKWAWLSAAREYSIEYLEVTRGVPQGEKQRLRTAVSWLGKSDRSLWADTEVNRMARGCACTMNIRGNASKAFCLSCSLRTVVSWEICQFEMPRPDAKRSNAMSEKDLMPS